MEIVWSYPSDWEDSSVKDDLLDDVMADVYARRVDTTDPKEDEYSVGDWIERIRQCCEEAKAGAREGNVQAQEAAWQQCAAYAIGALEYFKELRSIVDAEADEEVIL